MASGPRQRQPLSISSGFARDDSPAGDFVIRSAGAEDLPRLLDLYAQLLEGKHGPLALEEAKTIWRRINDYPDYRIFVAEQGRNTAGTFAVLIMDSLGHRGIPVAVLEDVVVAKPYRGQGVGKKMMAFLTDYARRKGCEKIFFCSGQHRLDAHRFYEKLGFSRHGFSYYLDL